MCRPVLQILTRFQTKKCTYPHPFSGQISKIHTRFQTWPLERNYDISTYIIERKQKDSSNPFRICMFLFLSHSFGIETTNTFIRGWDSLENHTRLQTKMGKVYTRLQTKRAQKPYLTGRHIPIWVIYGSTPPPGHGAILIRVPYVSTPVSDKFP